MIEHSQLLNLNGVSGIDGESEADVLLPVCHISIKGTGKDFKQLSSLALKGDTTLP